MRILLDTHILLWALAEPARLAKDIAAQLRDPEVEVAYSAVSIAEIAIKAAQGRIDASPDRVLDAAKRSGFRELELSGRHAARLASLPTHHRDPFDRLLVAQALEEPARLLTADRRLAVYSELVMLV